MQYEYDILYVRDTPNQPVAWFMTSNPGVNLGPSLHAILNQLGKQGWRVAGLGISRTARAPRLL